MNKDEKASISIKKIIAISILLVMLLGISVLASNINIKNVKIKFSNEHEITVLTTKSKVSEILEENHIVLEENEKVLPDLDEEIDETKQIIIYKIGEEPIELSEIETKVDIEELLADYENISEEIIVVTEEIPFETITKDVSSGSGTTVNTILQSGKNGKKETTYKVTYHNEEEILREELSTKIIKEPVDKIVQVSTKTVTSRSSSRTTGTSGQSGVYKVTAYCSCAKCCGKTNGITASGKKATSNNTIAAPSTFSFGTQVIINGNTYTVEDRGGAITGNRIDIYMDSHAEALSWGVRYLYVEVLD